MICKVCSGTYRKGSKVHMLNERGALVAARVCQSCARRAIALLPTSTTACKCGEPATLCRRCSRAKVKQARGADSSEEMVPRAIAKHFDALARAQRAGGHEPMDPFVEGKIEAFDAAASIVRKWGAS